MGNILAGLKDYVRAHRLILGTRMWRALLVPGLLSLIYYPIVLVLTFFLLTNAAGFVHENWVPGALQSEATAVLLSLIFFSAALVGAFIFFRNIILIIYSPVLGYLSETAERLAYNEAPPAFSWKGTAAVAFRAVRAAAVNLLLALVAMVIGWSLILVPGAGAILSVAVLAVTQSYFAGAGFMDPPLERRHFRVRRSLKFCWRNRGRVLGNGIGFTGMLLIPVIGWFLAPSYAIVAGTLGAADILRSDR